VADYPRVGFSELELEEINEDQEKVREKYWNEIATMQAPQIQVSAGSRDAPSGPPQPPGPRLPQKLFGILSRYAVELFDCQYKRYPESEKHTSGSALINLTLQSVVNQIDWLEMKTPSVSLTYHASLGQIHGAIRKALVAHFQALPRADFRGGQRASILRQKNEADLKRYRMNEKRPLRRRRLLAERTARQRS